jgi:hypothetical protein
MRGPSLETVRNIAMTLGGLSTFAIATGVGGPGRNRRDEEEARKAQDEARKAQDDAKKAQDEARKARDEAAQAKANFEAIQKKFAEFEARVGSSKK